MPVFDLEGSKQTDMALHLVETINRNKPNTANFAADFSNMYNLITHGLNRHIIFAGAGNTHKLAQKLTNSVEYITPQVVFSDSTRSI